MKARKLLRTVYTVQFDRRLDCWALFAGSAIIDTRRTLPRRTHFDSAHGA